MAAMRKIDRTIQHLASEYDAVLIKVRSGHIRIAGNGWAVFCASTPKDPENTLKNVQRDVRRAVMLAAA